MKQMLLLENQHQMETRELPLAFANTADWHSSDQPLEMLHTYTDLLSWAQQNELLGESTARQLTLRAETKPTKAGEVLNQAIVLREAIYRIFSATAKGQTPPPGDLAVLNGVLTHACSYLQVVQEGGGFMMAVRNEGNALEQMLWPVAYTAVALLLSDQLERVKVCEDDRGCGFLFFDTSKNRSRRWCTMESCGNRAKVRRHRRRAAKTGKSL